jgi:hypothetical protein
MQSERVAPAGPHISMSALIAACPKIVRRSRMTGRMSAADLAALWRSLLITKLLTNQLA